MSAGGPVAVILAGGTAQRMGGAPGGRDKGLLTLGRGTVLGAVIDRTEPQVAALALNANGDPARFARFGLPVLEDAGADLGPLGGVLAAMDWAIARGAASVITVPGDTPFLPGDLVPHLMMAAEGAPQGLALAESGGHLHPLCALWPTALRADLAAALATGTRKVRDWTARQAPGRAVFPATTPDGFFNINTPADLARAEGWLRG